MAWEADFLASLQNLHTPVLDTVMKFLSMLGDHGIFCICVGVALLFFAKTRPTGGRVLLSIALAYIFANLFLKNVVARPRPFDTYAFIQPLVEKPHDWSFPSGHSVVVFATATSIFLNHKKTGVLALIIAALVAFSRLYICVHYPTDVLAGAAIGIIFALLVNYLIYPACEKGIKKLRRPKEQ